jgi:poly-gamma-glutamate capsule biosynthesis protein CapA/YwtB (metallophosphatase superfamily)
MGETTVAVLGNTYMVDRVSKYRDPAFLRVVDILRGTDVVLCNLESAVPDSDDPPAFVAGGGASATHMVGTPEMLDDLKYMGMDGVCAANNHISDFGDPGILSTIRHLRAAGIPYAGIGASLTEASEPAYVDSPSGLRVAYIVACDWGPRSDLGLNFPWPAGYMPSDERPPFRSRPGVNLLRYEAVSYVSPGQLEELRRISQDLRWEKDKIYRRFGTHRSHPLVGMTTNLDVEVDSDTEVWFLGRKFVAAEEHANRTQPCQDDLERLYRQVRQAKAQADVVLVGLHDQSHGRDVYEYIRTFAYGSIDAGADIFFCNGGSHMGIELYKGKALMWGLPSFFLQTEAVTHLPSSTASRYRLPEEATAAEILAARSANAARAVHEAGGPPEGHVGVHGSAINTCVFNDDGSLREIRIQPLGLLGASPRTMAHQVEVGPVPRFRSGLPLFTEAGSATSDLVLDHVVRLTKACGTDIEVQDGIAVIRP